MRRIDELYLKYPVYGSRRMARPSGREGETVGRHRVRRLMRPMGPAAIYRKPRTSEPHPEHRIYPYLVRANQIRCADSTDIPVRRGFLYPAAIMDRAASPPMDLLANADALTASPQAQQQPDQNESSKEKEMIPCTAGPHRQLVEDGIQIGGSLT